MLYVHSLENNLEIADALLDQGYEPFAVSGKDTVWFKRMKPCEECPRSVPAEVGSIFFIRGNECVVTMVFGTGFEYVERRNPNLTFTHSSVFIPKDS